MTPDVDTLIDLLEAVEERAAIMEYEGGLSRDDAEALAFLRACAAHGLGCPAGVASMWWLPPTTEAATPDNRWTQDRHGAEQDDFLAWLDAMPHVQPEAPAEPPAELPAGWQDDPAWWARLVCGSQQVSGKLVRT